MAKYQIMYWNDIPSQIKAVDDGGEAKLQLPEYFTQAIDAEAMSTNASNTDAYLDAWKWGAEQTLPGTAPEVARKLYDEICERFPSAKSILNRKREE